MVRPDDPSGTKAWPTWRCRDKTALPRRSVDVLLRDLVVLQPEPELVMEDRREQGGKAKEVQRVRSWPEKLEDRGFWAAPAVGVASTRNELSTSPASARS